MTIKIKNSVIEVEDKLPAKGQYAYFNNKIWKVAELYGSEIMHLQRPYDFESVSLYGKQIEQVKAAFLKF
jgi:hypothetical protein